MTQVNVLDHGYVRFIEAWGHGDAGDLQHQSDPNDYECGIIEAARQSTQASFRGWEDKVCPSCKEKQLDKTAFPNARATEEDIILLIAGDKTCPECNGKGYITGDQRLLNFLFTGKPQHAGPFEFAGMVIEVQAPIFVFREWHRHRTQSYNEMSARYAPLPDLNYVPTVERLLVNSKTNRQAGAVKGAAELDERGALQFRHELTKQYEHAEDLYQTALKEGVPKELARVCLPVGRYSRMRASANLRNWLAFLTLRADPAAQWEIQQYAHAVGKIISDQFPRTHGLFAARTSKVTS